MTLCSLLLVNFTELINRHSFFGAGFPIKIMTFLIDKTNTVIHLLRM